MPRVSSGEQRRLKATIAGALPCCEARISAVISARFRPGGFSSIAG